jgi:hypothetical protein
LYPNTADAVLEMVRDALGLESGGEDPTYDPDDERL